MAGNGRPTPLSLQTPSSANNLYIRRTSLPAVFHGVGRISSRANNYSSLSPKLGFLQKISEFDMEPPFLSPASSSSSADTSPMLLSPTMRPASARFYRRRDDFSPTEQRRGADENRRRSYGRSDDHNDNGDFELNDILHDDPENLEDDGSASGSGESLRHRYSPGRQPRGKRQTAFGKSAKTPVFFQHSRANTNSQTPEMRKKFSLSTESPRSLHHYGRITECGADSIEDNEALVASPAMAPSRHAAHRNLRVLSGNARPEMRTFTVNSSGRILDSDIRAVSDDGKIFKPTTTKSHKSRRATCPEIWLSAAEEERGEVTRCVVQVFGCPAVGRKSVARQLLGSADVAPLDDLVSIASEELLRPSRTVSFMLNENEIQLEVELAVTLKIPDDDNLTVYMVVYSIDNRESFTRAAKIMYRLYEHRVKSSIPLILVANKIDLQRRRRVTTMEGKMLSKIYKCSFVEVSSVLSMNIDVLWSETLKKIHRSKTVRDRSLESGFATALAADGGCGASTRRNSSSRRFVGRILSGTRRFAKSCEELVAKMVAM